jgi:hypothetical protein
MDRQMQVIGGGVALVVLVGVAWFLFRPSPSPDVADVPRNKPAVEELKAPPTPQALPTPTPQVAAPVQVPADDPFLQIPVQELPDIPNSVKDPLGVLPITVEAMEMSVDEMGADLLDCRDEHLPAELHRVVSIDFHINAEVPPEDYGAPTPGEYGIVRGAKIMDAPGDHAAFEQCVTRVMADILYDKPAGSGSRVNWKLDLSGGE